MRSKPAAPPPDAQQQQQQPAADGQQPAPPAYAWKGQESRGTSAARVHPYKGDKEIIVSVYPKSLLAARKHVEARFVVIEGYLEAVKVAEVTVPPEAGLEPKELTKEDSYTLERKGVEFAEDFPSGAKVYVAAISTRRGGLNAGVVNFARFADRDLRTTSFSWKATAR